MTRIGVLGIGNELMGDDGIGPVLIRLIAETYSGEDDLLISDEGTGGFNIVHTLEGLERVLFIDSADMGLPAGEFRVFAPEDVESRKVLPRFSAHEGDLLNVIELSRALCGSPKEVWILAVQPGSIEIRESLSAELTGNLDVYLKAAERMVERLRKETSAPTA